MAAKGTRTRQDCSPESPGQVGPLASPRRWESRGLCPCARPTVSSLLGPRSPPRALSSIPGWGPKAVSATGRAVDELHWPHASGDRCLWCGLSSLCPRFPGRGGLLAWLRTTLPTRVQGGAAGLFSVGSENFGEQLTLPSW